MAKNMLKIWPKLDNTDKWCIAFIIARRIGDPYWLEQARNGVHDITHDPSLALFDGEKIIPHLRYFAKTYKQDRDCLEKFHKYY